MSIDPWSSQMGRRTTTVDLQDLEKLRAVARKCAPLVKKASQRDATALAYREVREELYRYVGQRGGWSTRLLRRRRYRDIMRMLARIGAELGVDG